jgi:hypothetical protein
VVLRMDDYIGEIVSWEIQNQDMARESCIYSQLCDVTLGDRRQQSS